MNNASTPRSAPWGAVLLLLLSLGMAALSAFQWRELFVVQGGGQAVCAVNETVNCERVWSLPIAHRVQELLGLPVAALGLVWSLTALTLSVMYLHGRLRQRTEGWRVIAVRLTAAVGALACVTFATASAAGGVLCLTCVGTYLLVGAFAVVAFVVLPEPFESLENRSAWLRGAALTLLVAVLAYGLLLLPTRARKSPSLAAAGPDVAAYLGTLSWAEKQAVSDSLAIYRASATPDVSSFPPRHLEGSVAAPVKIVEFTDILCPHCRTLQNTLAQLKRGVPEGSLSVEGRHFPLDAECNPFMRGQTDGKGVRCLAARVQICLEGKPDFAELRMKLFEAQRSLTRESVMALASSGVTGRAALQACVDSPQTQEKLQQDIFYAWHFAPQGTPLVVVNGREATPVGPFLYALALTHGNADHAAFRGLPPPSEVPR